MNIVLLRWFSKTFFWNAIRLEIIHIYQENYMFSSFESMSNINLRCITSSTFLSKSLPELSTDFILVRLTDLCIRCMRMWNKDVCKSFIIISLVWIFILGSLPKCVTHAGDNRADAKTRLHLFEYSYCSWSRLRKRSIKLHWNFVSIFWL